jgi:hypothetical protein
LVGGSTPGLCSLCTRLERLCKSRNVTWTIKHFYGQEPLPAAQEQQQQVRLQPESVASAPSASAQGSGADKPERQVAVEAATAVCKPKQQQQQRKAEKAVAGVASVGANSKGRASGTSAAKQSEDSAGLSKLRVEDGGGSTTPAPGAAPGGHGARHGAAAPQSGTPDVAQVRGPKALFKQWKIMQQQGAGKAHIQAVRGGDCMQAGRQAGSYANAGSRCR